MQRAAPLAPSLRFWSLVAVLSPIVVPQALYTRRSALRLPDAQGPRSGTAGSGGSALRLRVVGESTTAGVGAERSDEALPCQLAGALARETGGAVYWSADGVTGCKLDDVARRLDEDPPEEDLVVVFTGVNDTTGLTSLTQWRRAIQQTAECAGQNGSRVVFLALPPMGEFTALPRPLRTLMGLRAQQLDQTLRGLRESAHFDFIPWRISLETRHLARDGYHPSAAGYAAIARDCAARMQQLGLIPGISGNDSYHQGSPDET